jgi:CheY-like chemotaxis protein/HPt (histidine-containing phosphotransfer) domain-containing protein
MPRDIVKGLEAGFFRYLTKPIKVSEFMDTLRMALELADQRTAEAGRAFPLPDARVIVPIPRTTGLRILVAEDHPVNQEVARQILQRLGHHVEVVADGHAALAALEQPGRGTFDLVLMDVQMPVMGGLEATGAIRDAERATGMHLPIVALTAHAMHGDRERFLEAGMDGYVTKPIDGVELTRIISQLVPDAAQGSVPAAAVPVAPVAAGRPAFDERFIRERLGDNPQLFAELVRLFLGDYPARMRAMRRAISTGDGEALREAAHALKGAAANFAAAPVVEAARRLESQGRNGDLRESAATYAVLTREMPRLRRALGRASHPPRTSSLRQRQSKAAR